MLLIRHKRASLMRPLLNQVTRLFPIVLAMDERDWIRLVCECQSALKIDPLSACKIDPPEPFYLKLSVHLFSCFEAVTIVASFYNIAMVGHSIQHGCGHFFIDKNLRPLPKTKISSQDKRNFFIQLTD